MINSCLSITYYQIHFYLIVNLSILSSIHLFYFIILSYFICSFNQYITFVSFNPSINFIIHSSYFHFTIYSHLNFSKLTNSHYCLFIFGLFLLIIIFLLVIIFLIIINYSFMIFTIHFFINFYAFNFLIYFTLGFSCILILMYFIHFIYIYQLPHY